MYPQILQMLVAVFGIVQLLNNAIFINKCVDSIWNWCT